MAAATAALEESTGRALNDSSDEEGGLQPGDEALDDGEEEGE